MLEIERDSHTFDEGSSDDEWSVSKQIKNLGLNRVKLMSREEHQPFTDCPAQHKAAAKQDLPSQLQVYFRNVKKVTTRLKLTPKAADWPTESNHRSHTNQQTDLSIQQLDVISDAFVGTRPNEKKEAFHLNQASGFRKVSESKISLTSIRLHSNKQVQTTRGPPTSTYGKTPDSESRPQTAITFGMPILGTACFLASTKSAYQL